MCSANFGSLKRNRNSCRKVNAVSREEIEQVEKELDAVLEMVQRPVTVKM